MCEKGLSAACQMSSCSKLPLCVFIMDNALEIDAFITSQHGGNHKYVSFPLADKFSASGWTFFVSFFFDTLATQSLEAQRLACRCRPRPLRPPTSIYTE